MPKHCACEPQTQIMYTNVINPYGYKLDTSSIYVVSFFDFHSFISVYSMHLCKPKYISSLHMCWLIKPEAGAPSQEVHAQDRMRRMRKDFGLDLESELDSLEGESSSWLSSKHQQPILLELSVCTSGPITCFISASARTNISTIPTTSSPAHSHLHLRLLRLVLVHLHLHSQSLEPDSESSRGRFEC
ncbi:hypothetical protein BT96DRAFT_623612 [Gymnopus androsaceus JB14]|uniref:Uncharacterized protein n=1 Tax=Gymnopus androsaceus JB14 TaxID=1447944 RepID=A0A6A4IIH1_9AGAR|nr:hypothetical protein BT96DRAFT_623612 [Gymnopus androsaceus JB14]